MSCDDVSFCGVAKPVEGGNAFDGKLKQMYSEGTSYKKGFLKTFQRNTNDVLYDDEQEENG